MQWYENQCTKNKDNLKEKTKMKKDKKELIKKFNAVVEDLLDHYEEYSDEEKAQVQEVFKKVADLNAVLDKYDDDAAKLEWKEYFVILGNYFEEFHY